MNIQFLPSCFLFFTLLFSSSAQAQYMESLEGELLVLELELGAASTDELRAKASNEIKSKLTKSFKKEECFAYPFDQLTKIATLESPDDRFRLFNWQIPQIDGTSRYECLVLLDGGKKHVELVGSHSLSDAPTNKTLAPQDWYGCLYYDLLVTESKQGKFYTLLGWDAADEIITRKVLDVLTIGRNNEVELGAPVFELDGEMLSRRVFTYSEEVVMTMRYIGGKKAIVFDHLSPVQSRLEGNYSFYGPSDSFDAYEWNANAGTWVLSENVDMSRPKGFEEKPQFNFPARPDLSRSRDTINPLIGK